MVYLKFKISPLWFIAMDPSDQSSPYVASLYELWPYSISHYDSFMSWLNGWFYWFFSLTLSFFLWFSSSCSWPTKWHHIFLSIKRQGGNLFLLFGVSNSLMIFLLLILHPLYPHSLMLTLSVKSHYVLILLTEKNLKRYRFIYSRFIR